ncbi:DNA topoisomerase 2 [Naganishia friedmannii]|uniref:DNA topoisomerase 2 n=1 Tax=Naganishia friedmannii TaxID=89922 RepID=A0ACC2UWQ7_9TREE|nr:DNA topoisomerase 2 [Naganishia friedmannii]
MSDSEVSFQQSDDEGSDFAIVASPAAGKKKAAAVPAASKAKTAPVAKATTTTAKGKGKATASAATKKTTVGAVAKKAKAPLKAKKNAPNHSMSDADDVEIPSDNDVDMDGDGSEEEFGAAPPAAVQQAKGPKKTASEMYQKLSQLEHVLKRPDSYIGSVEHLQSQMWIFDKATKAMAFKQISYVPGFFKIFDEILVNAADNKINDATMETLKIVVDREKNQISVFNNGKGIPIEIHTKEKIWIPELIFGNLLTSSNYDDDQKKLTGGRNGYGAKLANIYSLEFIVETADKNTSKKYKQVFSNNMSKKGEPKITENKKGEEYTRITFKPDLARFGMTEIDDDTEALLMKRVYDMAGTVRDVKVFLNDERLKVKGFKQYIDMYLQASIQDKMAESGGGGVNKPTIVYETSKDGRWEVGFTLSDGQPQQVSFANSISTIKGGTHVDAVANLLANKLMEQIKKKNKAAPVKPFQIKNHMWIFVNALIENPAFDSQTKETLTLKASAFGSKVDLSDAFIKKVANSGIVDNVLNWAKFKSDQMMKKTDGAKRSRISGIVKLEDANNAGGKKAKDCTLILTEGDSAKALAVSGLSVVGRDNYGVFPLRGKLLNVREATTDSILKNQEIQFIKQIMGLKHNADYKSVESLRYGSLMIMTDQDHDGSHIKGLILNFLDHFYPSLLKIPGFLIEFITPIVKVWKGKQELTFYTMPQYEEWKEQTNNGKGWDSKYYKGLGTSTAADAKKYFSDLDKHKIPFQDMQPGDRELIDLAFNKKKADDRKEWLRQFKPGTYLDHDINEVPISDFINKELILFSMADNIRSIPSVADGLKPGQRKVLFGCFKRKLVKEIKVAQLAGYVSEKTAYHHGEQSLVMTIVGLAQNFVGSNNINLLAPNGQFGTRIAGGKDAASARYIFTNIPRMTRALFHPNDDPILKYQVEDDMGIEPEYYLPVVPLVLIDGADGIGTGWSTAIPNYNPLDIVENLRRKMRGDPVEPMAPWYRGFKGTIERVAEDKYKCSGIINKIDSTTVEITELPIKKWTQDYKEMLEEWIAGTEKVPATVKDYREYHTDSTVHFVVTMSEAELKKAEDEGLEKRFRLVNQINTSNMVCFDLNGKIKKYTSPEEILEDFYEKRLEFYGIRKQHMADELTRQYERISNQARFVQMIVKKELIVSGKKKAILEAELRDLKFKPYPKSGKAREDGEEEDTLEEEEGKAGDFDYLLGMAIWSLTNERVEKMLNELKQKEGELDHLLSMKATDIWNNDLEVFLAEWEAMLESDAMASKRVKPKPKTAAAKKLAAVKRKLKGLDTDEESEEDYLPTKAAIKAKKLTPVKRKIREIEPIDEVSDDQVKKVKPLAPKAAVKKPQPPWGL